MKLLISIGKRIRDSTIAKKLIDIWNLFRRGKNEITFLVSLYTLYKVEGLSNGNLNILLYAAAFIIAALIFGIIGKKIIDPYNSTRLSPYLQDAIKADIHHWQSILYYIQGNDGEALHHAEKAIKLLEKWQFD